MSTPRPAKRTSPKALNGSAYRIYKILQWLIQSPMSVEALNQRFCEDPQIGKPVSNDSIWLYINTLKHLGCKIRRPSLRNQFQYELLYHPFGIFLSQHQLGLLTQVKALAQKELNHSEIRTLDGLFKKMIRYGSGEQGQHGEEVLEQLFTESRSLDYESCQAYIEQLESYIAQGHSQKAQLLELTYLSPLKGEETFYFLPLALFYEQGILYLRGEQIQSGQSQNHQPRSSHLRVERIRAMAPVKNPSLLARLIASSLSRRDITLHVLANSPALFNGFNLSENHGVFRESFQWIPAKGKTKGYYQVDWEVRDFFSLKQRLLSCGFTFRVLNPTEFREEMMNTVSRMLALYHTPSHQTHQIHQTSDPDMQSDAGKEGTP